MIGTIIVEFEKFLNLSDVESIDELDAFKKAAWCVLYCGGSLRVKDELSDFSKRSGVGFECELFDW